VQEAFEEVKSLAEKLGKIAVEANDSRFISNSHP